MRPKIVQTPWHAMAPSAVCVALALITFAVFTQTFGFKFLNFDDNLFISQNPRLTQGLSAQGLAWAFTANLTHDDANAEYWEPLTLVSRLADVQFFGLNAGAHHRTNVLLHLAAGLVLFGALRAFLRSDLRSGLIAGLFLIHPLHVEPVAWLSARKDILNALFFFGTIWAYAYYAARPSRGRFTFVGFVFLCANMAKPMAVSLPFVLLLLDFWPLGRLHWPFINRAAGRLVIEKVPLILIAGVVALLAIVDQQRHGAMGDNALYPLSARLGSVAIGYCAYLVQTFVPTNLAILYPHPGTGLSWSLAAISAACFLLITALCILTAKRRPWLFVGWFWYVGVLLPVSGIVQIGEMARADRYTYISLVGIFLLCVQEASAWLVHAKVRNARGRTALSAAAAVFTFVILGGLAVVSWRQTKTWYDSTSVFRHAIAVTNDNYIAEANLGSALFAAGHKAEGLAHYHEALRLNAPALEHHRQAAIEAERRHQLPIAIQHYGKVLTLLPWDAEVHQRLGSVLLQNGDYAKALVQYLEALRYDRNAIPPRLGAARVLIAQQRFIEARGLLTEVLQLEANNEEAVALLGTLPSEPAAN
jgi:cytochrome c-type biogenesis protein CcmH/NrfG